MAKSLTTSKSVIVELAMKIRSEMKDINSDAHNLILRDTIEAVYQFSWKTVMLELQHKLSTLTLLLIPLFCFVASILLKSRYQRLGLVQHVISVMLYGNSSSKQVIKLWSCIIYSYVVDIKSSSVARGRPSRVQVWLPIVGCALPPR